MRTLEIRRHSMRQKPTETLSDEGIALAEYIAGTSLSNTTFSQVISSTIPRAIHTAQAMGVTLDETIAALGYLPPEILKVLDWPCSFKEVASIIASNNHCLQFAMLQTQLWKKLLMATPLNQTSLVITHGLFIEFGSKFFLSDHSHLQLGKTIGYCEGIRLEYAQGSYQITPLRVSADRYLVDS